MNDKRKSPRSRGAVVQLWRADRQNYNALEATEQRFFNRFQESVFLHDYEQTPQTLADVLEKRTRWIHVLNEVLRSNYGGQYD